MSVGLKYIVILSVLHSSLYVISLVISFTSGMDRVLDGAEMNIIEILLTKVNLVLGFPVMPMLESQSIVRFSGLWGYFPILLNSFLWAFSIYHTFGKTEKFIGFLNRSLSIKRNKTKASEK